MTYADQDGLSRAYALDGRHRVHHNLHLQPNSANVRLQVDKQTRHHERMRLT